MAYNCTVNDTTCLQGIEKVIVNYDHNLPSTYKRPLISDEVKEILEICIHATMFISTSFFGIVANVINITVYWKQGLKDSITLGFFALSISDLFLVCMSLVTGSCYAAKIILPNSNIDFSSVHYISSGTLRNMGYSISSVLTAFLSLERCCCVVLPFKVKFIFTRSRTAVILMTILVSHVLCYIPFFATQGLRWTPDIYVNNTVIRYKLRVYFSEYRPPVEKFSYILLGIVTPTASQIIVTVCAVVLTNGLRASSKFRQAMSSNKTVERQNLSKMNAGANSTTKGVKIEGKFQESVRQNHLTNRDARLVKAMIFLVFILSMSNIPLLMITYAQSLVPDLNIGRTYQNTYSTSYSIVYVLSSLNASLNIFVYYHTSAKYKEIFNSLLCSKKG